MIESGVTFDCAQLVVDDEIAAMIKHCLTGVPVTDQTLAVEDIAAVGPFGDFLSLDATMRHMREQSMPKLMDRRVREDWEERGATDVHVRAREKALEIVEGHEPVALDSDVATRIRQIVELADRDMALSRGARVSA